MKKTAFILLLFCTVAVRAQKIESIYFNLYTDSLKKGVYNYINVDGKLAAGNYLPLMTDEIIFTSTAGKWDGNSLIIDRSSKVDSVVITATLKSRVEVKKCITMYVKKTETEPPLKTEEELLNEWKKKGQRRN